MGFREVLPGNRSKFISHLDPHYSREASQGVKFDTTKLYHRRERLILTMRLRIICCRHLYE